MSAELSILDKVIREIAPGLAVRRMHNKAEFDFLSSSDFGNRSAYEGASTSRFRKQRALGRSRIGSEEHQGLTPHFRKLLLLETRDLYRNSPMCRGLVNCFTDYAVFNGVWPRPATSDSGWNKLTRDYYRDVVSPTVDFRQRKGVDMVEFQKLAIKHRILDGDLGFLMMKNGQLLPVESQQIDTPFDKQREKTTTMGVRHTKKGILIGYYVLDMNQNGTFNHNSFKTIDRDFMIHPTSYDRINQVRGIPDLASIVTKLRDLHTTEEFILNKVKHEGTKLYNVEENTAGLGIDRATRERANADGKDLVRIQKQEWGWMTRDKISPIEPKSPNSQYMPFVEHQVRSFAAAMRIPFEYIMMMFTQSSFSAQRAGALHAQHTFSLWTRWLVSDFLERHYIWRISKAINVGQLPPAPVNQETGVTELFQVEWTTPAHGSVDPMKQASANRETWLNGEKSFDEIIRSQGGDRDRAYMMKAEDIVSAHRAAEKAMADEPGLAGKLTYETIISTSTNIQTPKDDKIKDDEEDVDDPDVDDEDEDEEDEE